jgi:phospholipid/cholesterol/gamma-HCH transport system ATP-binding protein
MSGSDAAVRVTDVGQSFGGRTIYRHISFAVRYHEVFVILGGSGSGKSTLLRQIIGLLPPHEGRVEVLGEDVYTGSNVLERIGVMYQSGALFGSMTLLENVMLPLEMHSDLTHAERAQAARVKLGLVGLSNAEDLLPAEISGGMIKRGAIARALALDPPLLFLDEPSAGLDPSTSAGLDRLILDLRQELGTTFVVVTHDLGSILTIADRCIMLDAQAQGIIAEGDPRRLNENSENPVVHRFFHREAA